MAAPFFARAAVNRDTRVCFRTRTAPVAAREALAFGDTRDSNAALAPGDLLVGQLYVRYVQYSAHSARLKAMTHLLSFFRVGDATPASRPSNVWRVLKFERDESRATT